MTSSIVRRAEALLRSVVGITAAEVRPTRSGGVESVRVAVRSGLSSGQVVQNVRSALFAALGVSVHATQVELVPADEWMASSEGPSPDGRADGSALADAPGNPDGKGHAAAPENRNVNGHHHGSNGHGQVTPGPAHGCRDRAFGRNGEAQGNGHGDGNNGHANGNGSGNGHGPSASENGARAAEGLAVATRAPAPEGAGVEVEQVELIRHGGRIRCRVVLSRGAERFSAIADAVDEPMAEIPLAGRVACDALRAGQLTSAQFDGATITYLAGRTHVLAGLTELTNGGRPEHLSGSAVVMDSLEYAAAAAVVQALRETIQRMDDH